MESIEENPVITRLKAFMAYTGLTNSQFADMATIPRPTLSQLLHGRNKSVSDQLLKKLHDTFPNLNVSWLLFGKGEMLMDSNIAFSEPQNVNSGISSEAQSADRQQSFPFENAPAPSAPADTIRRNAPQNAFSSQNMGVERQPVPQQEPAPAYDNNAIESLARNIDDISRTCDNARGKKIKSIIVFYMDSSFEVFSPADSD